jgi:hypothetical protein
MLKLRQPRRPNATHVAQLFHRREPTMRGTPIKNPLRRHSAHPRQRVKLRKRCRVEIYHLSRPCGTRHLRGIRLLRRWRYPDRQLLTIGQPPSEVETHQVSAGKRTTDRTQRLSYPGTVWQVDQTRARHPTYYADHYLVGRARC